MSPRGTCFLAVGVGLFGFVLTLSFFSTGAVPAADAGISTAVKQDPCSGGVHLQGMPSRHSEGPSVDNPHCLLSLSRGGEGPVGDELGI